MLHRIYPCTVEEFRVTGQKELRIIQTLEPVLNQHRLVVDTSLVQQDQKVDDPVYRLFYQMTRITKDRGSLRHDDKVDVLAMAVSYWTDRLSKDVRKAEDEYRERLKDEEIRKFLKEGGMWWVNRRSNYRPPRGRPSRRRLKI